MIKINKTAKFLFLGLFSLQLHALSLDEALKTALQHSRDLKKSAMSLDIAQKDIEEKKSANYGRVDVMASLTHYNLPRTLTPLTPASMASGAALIPTTQDMMVAGVAYNVNLFNGYSDTRSIEISSLQKDINKNFHKLSREQIIYNVKTLYINILSLKAKAKAQELYVEALQQLHEDISLKVKLGSAAKIDELKSMADIKRAQTQLIDIQTNIKILKETLASVMYVPEIDTLEEIPNDIESVKLLDVQEYKQQLLESSRVKIAALEVAKKQKIEEKSQSVYYPKVTFNAYYGQNGGINDSTNPNSGDFKHEDVWQAGVDLKWNVFDFGSKHSMVQKNKIMVMQSKLDKEKVVRDLQKSLVEALSKIEQSVQNYQSAQSELTLMEETQKIEQIRYENGASDINDLLYTKARYQMAKSSYISAQYNYQNALNYLYYVLEQGDVK